MLPVEDLVWPYYDRKLEILRDKFLPPVCFRISLALITGLLFTIPPEFERYWLNDWPVDCVYGLGVYRCGESKEDAFDAVKYLSGISKSIGSVLIVGAFHAEAAFDISCNHLG